MRVLPKVLQIAFCGGCPLARATKHAKVVCLEGPGPRAKPSREAGQGQCGAADFGRATCLFWTPNGRRPRGGKLAPGTDGTVRPLGTFAHRDSLLQ